MEKYIYIFFYDISMVRLSSLIIRFVIMQELNITLVGENKEKKRKKKMGGRKVESEEWVAV